LVDNS